MRIARARPGGRALCVWGFALALATACAHGSYRERVEARAEARGLVAGTVRAGPFLLSHRLRAAGDARLVVYLEGDVDAWPRDRHHVATAPPPVHPLALELAARDPAPSVAWLGRPCQPPSRAEAEPCEPSLWSHGRFSETVVAALDAGLDALRREAGARRLELVGYSGGGVLAALLAARRDDVARLVTVAAPLDLAAWIDHHDLGALDAADPARLESPRLDAMRQVHWVGGEDAVVPPAVVRGYAARRPGARVEVVPGRGHGDWADGWSVRIGSWREE